jgi:hypothetical protein
MTRSEVVTPLPEAILVSTEELANEKLGFLRAWMLRLVSKTSLPQLISKMIGIS